MYDLMSSAWYSLQGTPPDLVIPDEELGSVPLELRELRAERQLFGGEEVT